MHRLYVPVSEVSQQTLQALSQEVNFKEAYSIRRRMGDNGNQALSVYRTSNWYDWTSAQRELFKAQLPTRQVEMAMTGWFLELPAQTGFLDRITTWKDSADAGVIIAYALEGPQSLWLNDTEVTVKARQGIGFSLRTTHEIKPSTAGQRWACLMVKCDFNLFA